MSELIRAQLTIIAVMLCCGLCGGMIHSVFQSFERLKKMKTPLRIFSEMMYFLTLGFLYSEFSFFCENGKLSFLGLFSFIAGLWLWKRFFCGILLMGEGDERKEEQTGEEAK